MFQRSIFGNKVSFRPFLWFSKSKSHRIRQKICHTLNLTFQRNQIPNTLPLNQFWMWSLDNLFKAERQQFEKSEYGYKVRERPLSLPNIKSYVNKITVIACSTIANINIIIPIMCCELIISMRGQWVTTKRS